MPSATKSNEPRTPMRVPVNNVISRIKPESEGVEAESKSWVSAEVVGSISTMLALMALVKQRQLFVFTACENCAGQLTS